MARAGSSTAFSPSSMALARTTSSSAVEQRDLADLLEVHPDRVVDPDQVGGQGLQVLFGLGLLLARGGGDLLVGLGDQGRLVVRVQDLDAALFRDGEQLLDLVQVRLGLRDHLQDLVLGDEAFAAALLEQGLDRGVLGGRALAVGAGCGPGCLLRLGCCLRPSICRAREPFTGAALAGAAAFVAAFRLAALVFAAAGLAVALAALTGVAALAAVALGGVALAGWRPWPPSPSLRSRSWRA